MTKNGTYLSLSQAASLTGKSKSVIYKALKNGTLSYQEKNSSGYKIDRSELSRVFTLINENKKNDKENAQKEQFRTTKNDAENALRIKELEIRLDASEKERDFYKEQLEKLEKERDDWKQHAQTLLLQRPHKPTGGDKRIFGWFGTKNSQ